jgi:hypothetical protein
MDASDAPPQVEATLVERAELFGLIVVLTIVAARPSST